MSKEIPKESYKSPENRQKIIDNLRSVIILYLWNIKKSINQPSLEPKIRLK